MADKFFFEVLSELKVEKKIRADFETSIIKEIVFKKEENELVFLVESPKVLFYKNKKEITNQIKRKLFQTSKFEVDVNISYKLPTEYTVEKITSIYKDSIIEELYDKKLVLYLLLKNSVWEVTTDTIAIKIANKGIRSQEIKTIETYITNLYKFRFDKNINCAVKLCDEIAMPIVNENIFIQERERIEQLRTVRNPVKPSDQVPVSSSSSKPKPKENSYKPRVKVDMTNMIYGRNCEGNSVQISDIIDEIGEVCVQGQLISIETREIRAEKTIFICDITDFTDTITFKIFVENNEVGNIISELKKGEFYKVKGVAAFDKFDKEISLSSIRGIKKITNFQTKRSDTADVKRVELHLHTKMSDMDSVVDIKAMIKRAKEWGMPAVAITDHGCLQAFPIANHCIDKDDPFKIIYGVEAYFVDDIKKIVTGNTDKTFNDEYVIFDLETTGLSPTANKIIEIGAVKIKNCEIIDTFSTFVNPEINIPSNITELTSITNEDVINAPKIETVLPQFIDFCQDSIMVAHNADFDMSFILNNSKLLNLKFEKTVVDTVGIARILLTDLGNSKLSNIAKKLKINLQNHHRAVDDAKATCEIFLKFIKMLAQKEINNLTELNMLAEQSKDAIKKLPTYHGIILVKNEIGRVNLNKLVSLSHLDYFARRPRMPKSLIEKYREGLIIGSACEAGEVFSAILRDSDNIEQIVNFYDYLEIQPEMNNEFMIRSEKHTATCREDLRNYNRRIIELGEIYDKKVVATCDVHFLDPEDEIYRRILMDYKGFKDADFQAPLYFRTTNEMLEEFSYLGRDKAYEIVVTNTNEIANQIEKISPVLPDKYPPIIKDSDKELRKICYDKAHEIYGPNLPEIVTARLERELNSIINNGYAVMYIIAQKLVWDSNDHGYLVGSRGSVGSSFTATMSGITEVNPLPAHYICPNCYYTDFETNSAGTSGCDMPDKDCPKCSHALLKEGHDIPFETFLGFYGDKEPDIDLNFSGEYQAKAHKYVEVLFGEGKAYRAGTIGTVADKTALMYVYKYFEKREITKRRAEMRRIANGCTGVKRTTGQHPGGIIVVPQDHDIYEFCAVQHPANDTNTPIITTHYEYHSIDHNLLKLDILGHDDPTIIRRLEDLTGISSSTIKLDDKDVMSLFHSTKILKIEPSDISGIKLGSLGIPEFGTDFVIQMLIDAKPQSFSDLVRISGLSHGTDVWLGNAQTLLEEGKGTISSVICTRDDIMTYLISMGLEDGLAFTIMESVRKGKGLKPEWEEAMLEKNVPDWYIWSCKKIKYMFPKAHAAAYVMMAWRIAWYKVFYPLEYYTAFFSIRASSFNYETMCFGKEVLEKHMKEIMLMPKEKQTAKDQDTLKDMRIVQEMYARGFSFKPIDLFVASDIDFKIVDGQIMPAIGTIDGLGDKAATLVVEAVKNGPFLSRDDFKKRTKVNQNVTEKMFEFGILGNIPASNQISFLDYLM
ncbi:PolC-type DNA polymerase III [Candidatus Epulonipiscioides gigas]|nr:PolC-type DNA polymerase III [Epulopiscium sp. SCG-C07WGA-EpuloA2]